jgi:hypothetical protein
MDNLILTILGAQDRATWDARSVIHAAMDAGQFWLEKA